MLTTDLRFSSCGWSISLVLTGLVILLLYMYGTWTHSTWSRVGIPGPKPLPFIGNLLEFRSEGIIHVAINGSKKYGKNFGIYMTRQPLLLTTDADILKEVFIKDFDNFADRMSTVSGPLMPYPLPLSLTFVNGEQWRRQRLTMNPTFSASKLKMMGIYINRCCQNLARSLEKSTDSGQLLDEKKTFGSFTLDVIAGTGFGFDCNSLEDDSSPFLKSAQEVLGSAQPFTAAVAIANVFPMLGKFMRKLGFSVCPLAHVNFVKDTIRTIIEERKSCSDKTSHDLTQLMLDAEASDEEVANNSQTKSLTRDEIIAQGIIFFVVGFETTSATLQYLSYLLALNPDKQEKLHDEIVAAIGDVDPTYEKVMDIPYLDNCVRETLRLFPPVAIIGRTARQQRTIKGVTIPAGTSIGANVNGLMRDEEFFPEPERFLPERYQDDAHPIPQLVKDMVFGAGPRQCIAMRLALYEAKMATITMVRKFRFLKTKKTLTEIRFRSTALAVSDKSLYLATERR